MTLPQATMLRARRSTRPCARSRTAHADDVTDDPPVAIEIWRATIPLHDPANPTDVRVEHVRRVELG
jgi:hypothetical protein